MPRTLPTAADVIVVGAGLAGLATALRLAREGLDVVVVEAAERAGGRVVTDHVDGLLLDRGFQLLNPAYPALRRGVELEALDLFVAERGAIVGKLRPLLLLAIATGVVSKAKSAEKIDGAVAAAMAIARAQASETGPSIFESEWIEDINFA